MKKKLLCIIVALLMIMQCTSLVQAKDLTDEVNPGIDMEIKKSTASVFKNGALRLTGESTEVDFKVTLEMDDVLGEFVNWYTRAESIINNVTQLDSSLNKDELMSDLNSLVISGQFIVKITYPEELEVPERIVTGGDMYGFNDEAKITFKEVSREIDKTSDEDNHIITITIAVTDVNNADGKLTAGELYENKEAYLDDITFTAEKIGVPKPGTYTARGTLEGYTETSGFKIGQEDYSLKVNYYAKQIDGEANGEFPDEKDCVSATVNLKKSSSPSGPSSSGKHPVVTDKPQIIFNVDGDTVIVEPLDGSGTVNPEDLPKPEKPGYEFDGWYHDAAHKDFVDEPINVTGSITLYGHWKSATLDSEDHFAYVIGYPDGTVRPENNISREEVATIFYRLLREDKLIGIASDENSFSDVETDRWSNKAISSLSNGGYINGYEDGTFRPANPITRAEFAAMATRYAVLSADGDVSFSDIEGHWAYDYIVKAATVGWVNGYEDGTFAPENNITRAEVMTIINRMLTRYVDEEGLHSDTKYWTDMDGDEWYYYNVLEATNAHDYERREDGMLEKWTQITENKIWVELDKMENAN